jgi:hypothetical protein
MSEAKSDAAPTTGLETFIGWLEAGKLDDFGPKKLAVIRQKLRDGEHEWLCQLANSNATGRVLGVVK